MIQRTPAADSAAERPSAIDPQSSDGLVTYDDFCVLVADGEKADLIDGVIHMASPDTKRSNELGLFLAYLIEGYSTAKGIGGCTFISRVACKISDTRAPEPDCGYVTEKRLHLVHENRMEGGPDIAIEIVSRDSRSRDYGEKRELYRAAGVGEYWIVDPLQGRVEFLRLQGDRYDLVPLKENRIFPSAIIPGLWINVDWLLARPTPRAYKCLQEILAG